MQCGTMRSGKFNLSSCCSVRFVSLSVSASR